MSVLSSYIVGHIRTYTYIYIYIWLYMYNYIYCNIYYIYLCVWFCRWIFMDMLFWRPTTAIQGRVPWNTPGAQLTNPYFIHSRNCGIARYGKYRLTMAYSWILSYSIHGQTRVVGNDVHKHRSISCKLLLRDPRGTAERTFAAWTSC